MGTAGVDQGPEALATAVRTLLAGRRAGATVCPSEVARSVGGDHWRELMAPVRAVAQRMVEAGELEVTQRGAVVDLATARGPVRLRRPAGH